MFEKIKGKLLCIGAAMILFLVLLVVVPLYLIEEKPWKQKLSEEERRKLEEKFRLGYISII